jgi:DNA polymerase-3 subunit delta
MSNQKQAYLFVGDDEYPLNLAARQLVNTLVAPADQAFGLEVIEGRADSVDDALEVTRRCHEALVTPGFLMTGDKVIWWRGVSFLDAPADKEDSISAGPSDDNDRVKEAVKGLVAAIQAGQAGNTVLLVTSPKVDKRSTFYKLFASRFEVREFFLPDKAYLVERVGREKIITTFKELGVALEPEALEMFLNRVGADSRQIYMEAEKLTLFLGTRRRATVEDIKMVVSTTLTSVMWDLLDAVGERKLPEALEVLRDLLAGKENPIGIVASLSSRMRDLVLYREGLDKGWVRIRGGGSRETAEWTGVPGEVVDVISSILKRPPDTIHPFVVSKMAQQARCYSASALRRNQRLLLETYETLVSSSVPNQTVLELMLVRLMT